MADHADLRMGRLFSLSLLAAGGFFLFMLAVQWALSQPTPVELAVRRSASDPSEARQVMAAEAAGMAEYRWVDAHAGVVQLPIERAMELVIQEHAADRRAVP